MKNFILRYGIIGGLVSSILGTLNWITVADSIGVSSSQMLGYLSITVSLMCIPLGVKHFRDHLNNGLVSFGQAFKIGLGITCIAGIVMSIHSMIFFALQKEEFIAWQRESLSGAELDAYNAQLEQMPDFAFSPWFQAIVMFVMVFLIGMMVNLISATVLKKRNVV